MNDQDQDPEGWKKARSWDRRFEAEDTPWELGFASPTLLALAREFAQPGQRAALPGCGRGDDALGLHDLGLDVVAMDWSPAAIAALEERARESGRAVQALVGDAYELLARLGPFDLIFENTFFCAQGPEAWPRYFDAMRASLRPGGLLLGAFFVGPQPEGKSGPPFFVKEKELRALLDPQLDCLRLMPSPVAPAEREGFEYSVALRRPIEAPPES